MPCIDKKEEKAMHRSADVYTDDVNVYTDDMNAYADGMNAYTDDMNAYADGMNAYTDDMNAYADGMNAYTDDMNAYADGMNAYTDDMNACLEPVGGYGVPAGACLGTVGGYGVPAGAWLGTVWVGALTFLLGHGWALCGLVHRRSCWDMVGHCVGWCIDVLLYTHSIHTCFKQQLVPSLQCSSSLRGQQWSTVHHRSCCKGGIPEQIRQLGFDFLGCGVCKRGRWQCKCVGILGDGVNASGFPEVWCVQERMTCTCKIMMSASYKQICPSWHGNAQQRCARAQQRWEQAGIPRLTSTRMTMTMILLGRRPKSECCPARPSSMLATQTMISISVHQQTSKVFSSKTCSKYC
eukprot:1156184-Pelagomonas_calceolata.AAC.9